MAKMINRYPIASLTLVTILFIPMVNGTAIKQSLKMKATLEFILANLHLTFFADQLFFFLFKQTKYFMLEIDMTAKSLTFMGCEC